MDIGSLDLISRENPREFFDRNLSIPYEKQRKHVAERVMLRFLRHNLHLKQGEIKIQNVVGSNLKSSYRKSEFIGNLSLFLDGYRTEFLLQPELGGGLDYFITLGQRAYWYAYKAGRKIKGNVSEVTNFEEMADNYRNLVKAIFEFKIRFLPQDKELSDKVLREMDLALYHGGLSDLYPILHGKSIEQIPTLH
ncbi:hypothetical protein J4480_06130 [Candidatus Woesearchaeota archaeon]|nr:hypothetical protein [Candidatus Woesearchaeota archaeon]